MSMNRIGAALLWNGGSEAPDGTAGESRPLPGMNPATQTHTAIAARQQTLPRSVRAFKRNMVRILNLSLIRCHRHQRRQPCRLRGASTRVAPRETPAAMTNDN